MPPTPISLSTASNPTRYGHEGAARLINAYVEQVGREGKQPWVVYAIDGWQDFATLQQASGGVQAAITVGSTMYAVCGRQVYAVDTSGTATLLGSLAASGWTTIAANQRQPNPQIVIVCAGLVYMILNNTLSQVNNPSLPPPVSVFEKDNYFVFPIADGRWFISNINDITVTAINFASAVSSADALVHGARRAHDILLIGTQTIEFWQDTGAAIFPFARTTNINIGCYAGASVSEVVALINDNMVDSVAWAATDAQGGYLGVMLLSGYSAMKISNHALDRAIQAEPDITSIRGFSWSQGGHVFYCIGGSSFSWVYDTVTRSWHERQSYGLTRWRANCHCQLGNLHLFGDYAGNKLYSAVPTAFDESGQQILYTVQCPPTHAYPFRLRFDQIYADAIPGVGLNSGHPENDAPALMIDYSDNGAKSFDQETREPLGVQGDFGRRVTRNRMGISRSRTYRFRCSAAVVRGLVGISLDFLQLSA